VPARVPAFRGRVSDFSSRSPTKPADVGDAATRVRAARPCAVATGWSPPARSAPAYLGMVADLEAIADFGEAAPNLVPGLTICELLRNDQHDPQLVEHRATLRSAVSHASQTFPKRNLASQRQSGLRGWKRSRRQHCRFSCAAAVVSRQERRPTRSNTCRTAAFFRRALPGR
jgi:hypothetical protein